MFDRSAQSSAQVAENRPDRPAPRGEATPGATMADMLDQAVDGIVAIDHENRVIFFNRAAERLWGLDRHRVIGQNVKMLVPGTIRDRHDDMVDSHRRSGEDKIVGGSRDLEMVRADGSTLWVNLALSKSVDDAGRISYLATVKDVTRQRTSFDEACEALDVLAATFKSVGAYSNRVRELAERTNLLAINASIEANRAGEHGRSFGVVATEVRSLAEGTDSAAEAIEGLLADTSSKVGFVHERITRLREG